MNAKLKKDDIVEVITGNDKGKRGRILEVDRKKNLVIVEGVNYRTYHQRVQQTKEGQSGGIEEREAPFQLSNVAVVDPQTDKPVRIGFKVEDGKKVRYTKGKNASGNVLEN